MRWSKEGAQTLLYLRAVALNEDWDDFQRFRRRQVHLARYPTPYPDASSGIPLLEAVA